MKLNEIRDERIKFFFWGFVIGALFMVITALSVDEYHDIPDELQWEAIGQELCQEKFQGDFYDWEDGELFCKRPDLKTFPIKEWNGTDWETNYQEFCIQYGSSISTWEIPKVTK